MALQRQGRVDQEERRKLNTHCIFQKRSDGKGGELLYLGSQLDTQVLRFDALHPQSRQHKD